MVVISSLLCLLRCRASFPQSTHAQTEAKLAKNGRIKLAITHENTKKSF